MFVIVANTFSFTRRGQAIVSVGATTTPHLLVLSLSHPIKIFYHLDGEDEPPKKFGAFGLKRNGVYEGTVTGKVGQYLLNLKYNIRRAFSQATPPVQTAKPSKSDAEMIEDLDSPPRILDN